MTWVVTAYLLPMVYLACLPIENKTGLISVIDLFKSRIITSEHKPSSFRYVLEVKKRKSQSPIDQKKAGSLFHVDIIPFIF